MLKALYQRLPSPRLMIISVHSKSSLCSFALDEMSIIIVVSSRLSLRNVFSADPPTRYELDRGVHPHLEYM